MSILHKRKVKLEITWKNVRTLQASLTSQVCQRGDTVFENTSFPLYLRLNGFVDFGLDPHDFKALSPLEEKYLQAIWY